MSPVFGALFSHKFNEKLGVGAGYYVSGGTNAEYKSVDFSGVKSAFDEVKPDVIAKLAVTEFSLGAGYKINENFNLGLSWRAVFIDAQFGSSKVTNVTALGGPAVLTSLQLKDLKDKNYTGFKLGAQYTSSDKKWGVGASFRNSIKIVAEGNVTATAESINAATGVPTTATALTTSGNAKIINRFPWNFHFDTYYQVQPVVKLLAGLTYTKYSENGTLVIDGSANGSKITNVNQQWKDQYNYRIASEVNCMKNIPIFFGYILTTQVTSSDYARATFASPGKGHTFTLGSGYELENMQFLIGYEHSQASGSATDTDNGIKGKYNSTGNTINTTFKLMF
ncbi:MAG: outer membrane protein transport protein [Bacteriovoracaceae bacterium]